MSLLTLDNFMDESIIDEPVSKIKWFQQADHIWGCMLPWQAKKTLKKTKEIITTEI